MKTSSEIIIRMREGGREVLAAGLDARDRRRQIAFAYAIELEEDRTEIEGLLARLARTVRRKTANEQARLGGERRKANG